MKNISHVLLAIFVGALTISLTTPGLAKAKSIRQRFNGNSYNGTWEVTSDPCRPENIGNTGFIIIQALNLKKKGGLKTNNAVTFDETRMAMSGKVFKKNDKYRVRFIYPTDGTYLDGLIKGRIKQTRIKGTYVHSSDGCTWSGSFNAQRQYN